MPTSNRHSNIKFDTYIEKYFKFYPVENQFPEKLADKFNEAGDFALNVFGSYIDLTETESRYLLVASQLNFCMYYLCLKNHEQVENIIDNIEAILSENNSGSQFLHVLAGF